MSAGDSPTRNYVAVCNKLGYSGYDFEAFQLPQDIPNNPREAIRYYARHVRPNASVAECISLEDYTNVNLADHEGVNINDFEIKEIIFEWHPETEYVKCKAAVFVGFCNKRLVHAEVAITRRQMEETFRYERNPATVIAVEEIIKAVVAGRIKDNKKWCLVSGARMTYAYGYIDFKNTDMITDIDATIERKDDGSWHWWLNRDLYEQGNEPNKDLAQQAALEQLAKPPQEIK